MTETEQSKKPTHAVYMIREAQSGDAYWTKIGSAWPHKDGHGFKIQLEAIPYDRQITLRLITDKPEGK